MKKLITIIVLVFLVNVSYCQPPDLRIGCYEDSLFSKNDYHIIKDSIKNGNSTLQIFQVNPLNGKEVTKVFVRRITKSSDNYQPVVIIENLFSGVSTAKDRIYYPLVQPFDKKYMLLDAKYKSPTIYVFNSKVEKTIILEGQSFALSEDSVIVYSQTERDNRYCRHNLSTGTTKIISKLPKDEGLIFTTPESYEAF